MEALLVAAGASAATAATVSTAFTVASTAFTVIGALNQGATASANYKAQAQASEYNAAASRNESQRALQESTAAQLAQRRKALQFLGTQRAAAAQAGVGFGGSTGDIMDQSSALSELDALNLAYEGEVKAKGFTAQSDLDTYYANVYRSNARSATTAGYFGAATALAAGASRYSPGGTTPRATVLGPGLTYGGGVGIKGLRLSGGY